MPIDEIQHINYAVPPKRHPPMYYMHKYWARKPYNVVAKYVETYSKPRDIVLDPFCGSGVTPIEALKLDRKAVAIDLDPMSIFITKMTMAHASIEEFENAFKIIEKAGKDRIYDLYKTRCNNCGKTGVLSHVVWKITDSDPTNEIPLEEWYYCDCVKGVQKKELDSEDKIILEEIPKIPIPYWVPDVELIWNTRVNVHKGTHVTDLFSHRNLIALSILFHLIDELPDGTVKDLMKFVFTGFVVKASRMNFVNVGGYKSLGRGWCVRGYWVPAEHMEQNVWNDFARQFEQVRKGKIQSNEEVNSIEVHSFDEMRGRRKGNILIENGSALSIPLPSNSVDYVFTDPPYGDSIPYLELHYLWSSWLKFDVNFDDEVIISDSPVRKDKNFDMYHKMLSKAFREIYRVLKPNKWLTVTFHNNDIKIYNSIIKAAILAGFDLEKIVLQPPAKTSAKGLLAPYGSAVGDYYIRFLKTEKESLGLAIYSEIDKEAYEHIIVDAVKKVIGEIGEPTPYSTIINSYPIIYSELKNNGYLFSAPEGIEEILKRNLNKEFVLEDVTDNKGKVIGQKWWLKGVDFVDRVPLSERVEAVTLDVLNREITVSFDDVLQHVYLNFTNALTPETQSVKNVLEEFAEKTRDSKWRLKSTIKQRQTEHNSMVELLAVLGTKIGFEVHADLKEWRGALQLNLPKSNLDRIKEIDVVWYKEGEITHEFEVENTTGIIEALVRGSNIPSLKTKRYVVIPEERQNFFYKRISEPLLKQKVEESGWQFIFYDTLTTFSEKNKKRKTIDLLEFERLGRIPSIKIEKQQSIEDFT